MVLAFKETIQNVGTIYVLKDFHQSILYNTESKV